MIVYILLAYAVYVLFSRIPLPGLPPFVRDRVLMGDNDVQRMSLIVLGVISIMTVLIYVEILKVLFPSFMAAGEKSRFYGPVIGILVIGMTLLQGDGILQAFMAMGYQDGRQVMIMVGLASFAGVSMLLFWFEGRIRLPGLDSGIWVLLAIPAFATLFSWLPQALAFSRHGLPLGTYTVVAAYVVAVIVLAAGACLLLSAGSRRPDALRMLLWPPVLANGLLVYLGPLVMVFLPETHQYDPAAWTLIEVALLVPLMATFVFGYCRIYGKGTGAEGKPALPPAMLAVPVFAVQVFIFAGSKLLNVFAELPVMVEGYMLTVCAAVMFCLLQLLRRA